MQISTPAQYAQDLSQHAVTAPHHPPCSLFYCAVVPSGRSYQLPSVLLFEGGEERLRLPPIRNGAVVPTKLDKVRTAIVEFACLRTVVHGCMGQARQVWCVRSGIVAAIWMKGWQSMSCVTSFAVS